MNALKYIDFLGHSSTYPAFDDLLEADGIKKRPRIGKSIETSIFTSKGLALSFTFTAKDEGIVPKDDGAFVFDSLEITLLGEDRGDGEYSGELPRMLKKNDARDVVEAKLKTLKRRLPNNDSYYVDGLVWMVYFKGDAIRAIRVSLPTTNKRKLGLCD